MYMYCVLVTSTEPLLNNIACSNFSWVSRSEIFGDI